MTAPTRYKIEHIGDLLDVPEDRLPALLAELPELLRRSREVLDAEFFVTGNRSRGRDLMPAATWIDDGKTDLTLIISAKDAP